MTLDKRLDYISWRKQEREILTSLKGKKIWLLFSGGKDSTLAFYFLYMAAQDFNFSFEVHAGAFPKHRYTKSEVDKIHSFWLEKGFEIQWHNIHNSDDILEGTSDPCFICQCLRKQLLFDVVGNNCDRLEDLVIVISYDLSDLVSYTLEYLTGGIYCNNGNRKFGQRRLSEVSHRFYRILRMDQGYTVYRPLLRYNEQEVIRIVGKADIPVLTVPCRYTSQRPKRKLAGYYEAMDLRFDYDKVFEFAKDQLGLVSDTGYTPMKTEDYLRRVF